LFAAKGPALNAAASAALAVKGAPGVGLQGGMLKNGNTIKF